MAKKPELSEAASMPTGPTVGAGQERLDFPVRKNVWDIVVWCFRTARHKNVVSLVLEIPQKFSEIAYLIADRFGCVYLLELPDPVIDGRF